MTSNLNSYADLVRKTAERFANVHELQFIRDDPHGIHVSEITGTGRINFILRVSSSDGIRSVIFKHARETPKGQPGKLDVDRQLYEARALLLLDDMVPGSVPALYCYDASLNMIVMEDMSQFEVLGARMKRGIIDKEIIRKVAILLAQFHATNSPQLKTPSEWEKLTEKFSNQSVRAYFIQHLFDRGLREIDPTCKISPEMLPLYCDIIADKGFLSEFRRLREMFFSTHECLLHADCHTYSVFVKDGSFAVFDLECAFMGPRAANLAVFLRNIGVCAHSTSPTMSPSHVKEDIRDAVQTFLETYLAETNRFYSDDFDGENLMREVAAYTAALMFRKITRSSVDVDIDISSDDKPRMLALAADGLLSHRSVRTVGDVIQLLFTPKDTEDIATDLPI